MRPVTFKAELTTGRVIELTGYPTGIPGLIVHESHESHGLCGGPPCWKVTHARSGWGVGTHCWDSPEGALAYAQGIADLTDWQQPFEDLLSSLRGEGTHLLTLARTSGGTVHVEPTRRTRTGPYVDNGVIA